MRNFRGLTPCGSYLGSEEDSKVSTFTSNVLMSSSATGAPADHSRLDLHT